EFRRVLFRSPQQDDERTKARRFAGRGRLGRQKWDFGDHGAYHAATRSFFEQPMVTVGTAVASRPPYRSRRALLTHRAPPSGSGVEAVTRQRVYRSDWRKEAGDALDEPLPAEACRLAAPL